MPGPIEGFPASVCLRVTRRCNAACSFCQAPPTSRAEPSVRDVGGTARFLAHHGVRSLKLSGGEPTMRGDLPEIVAAIADAGLKPVVITNGIAVPGRLIGVCADVGGEFKFSVHRPSEANDLILRRRSFGAVCENMAAVVAAGVGLSLNCVVTPLSITLMADLAGFAFGVRARKVSFIPVVARGRARSDDGFDFLSGQLETVAGEVRRLTGVYAGRMAVRCIDIRSHDYWIVENDGSLWIERATEEADTRVCGRESLTLET